MPQRLIGSTRVDLHQGLKEAHCFLVDFGPIESLRCNGLLGRRFDEVKLVIIYIDGMVFGDHTMVSAIEVDSEGHKHVLAIGSTSIHGAAC